MPPNLRAFARTLALASSLFLLGSFGLRARDRWFTPTFRVLFFDVGQGDSALLQLPSGHRWLIDGGGAFWEKDVGRQTLAELTARGVLTIDALVLSHPDADHGEGFRPLFKNLRIEDFWFHFTEKPLLRELMARAALTRTPLRDVAGPTSVAEKGMSLEFFPVQGDGTNNRALVVRAALANCSVLFTGDLEREGERRLREANAHWPRPTVLKVAHHGSRTSSTPEFLHRWAARFAVISSGSQNQYGHPNAMVVERLRQFRSTVLRTDFHGWIEFEFFPDSTYRCESAVGACGEGSCLTGHPSSPPPRNPRP